MTNETNLSEFEIEAGDLHLAPTRADELTMLNSVPPIESKTFSVVITSSGQQQKINCVHVKRWQRRAQVAPGFFMWNPSSQVFIGGRRRLS
ncbi:hypothetical protein F442_11543 [Phytophthora nicotianae P10297]|uniref:Uncharacterized protein n=2 Tax=Phytophthora nicotianae TaxID=4792 RepID=W2Z1Y3_PHYNI|nr:hypothetical protein L914_11170 [Phytophthora nicotianae]ETP41268.1 hypothetical protein F442_11543 [Phytophthora nicotianae P10297]